MSAKGSLNGYSGIFDEEFPDNVSVNDLCDCGRHKRHHPHKAHKDREPFPVTDYMSTYEAVKNPRPRSSKRPPMTARDPRPQPMLFSTNQKDHYKNLGNVERVKPIVREEKYEPPTEKLEGLSHYSSQFIPKTIEPEAAIRQKSRRSLLQREPATFDGTTTNRQHFKRWVPQPSLTFGELPSFTGSILFPGKENVPLSTMRHSFMGEWNPPADLIKNADASIKIEGDFAFDTTHNTTYQKICGDHRAQKAVHKDSTPLNRRGQFMGTTQTQRDFPGYRKGQPKPPRAIDPPPATIDLRFDNRRSFTTENRTTFRGHDINEHPPQASCKKEEEAYKVPSVKFATETSQKKDYQPIDFKHADNPKMKIPSSSMGKDADAVFDGKTMNDEFFQNWGVQPRMRYGDFHENRPYIPPQDPFNSQSVTQSSFIEKRAEPVQFYKPEEKPIANSGKFYHNTVYGEEFQKKQPKMCRAQVYLIQQELRRRKSEKQKQQQGGKCASAPSGTPTLKTNHVIA